MSIIDDYFELSATGNRKAGDFNKPALVSLDCKKTGDFRDAPFCAQDEYVLRGIISIRFFANPAQLEDARKIASKAMLQRIYGPMLGCISELRLAIHGGDAEEALRIVGKMQTEMGL